MTKKDLINNLKSLTNRTKLGLNDGCTYRRFEFRMKEHVVFIHIDRFANSGEVIVTPASEKKYSSVKFTPPTFIEWDDFSEDARAEMTKLIFDRINYALLMEDQPNGQAIYHWNKEGPTRPKYISKANQFIDSDKRPALKFI